MKTFLANAETIEKTHKFHLVDAEGKVLGRLATAVARLLMGKHKPTYTTFLDTGDHVIVVNAEKVKLTGQKLEKKQEIHHTMYPGGIKKRSYRQVMAEHPDRVIREAVKGMLPKSSLGRKMLKKLKVYVGPTHKHEAQKPEVYSL